MSSILDYYMIEELKKEYEELLENKKDLLFALAGINQLLAVVEHYFETGEASQELIDLLGDEEEDDDE